MKYLARYATAFALAGLVAIPSGAFAQTNTTSQSLQALLTQIQALQAQVQALQQQLQTVRTQQQQTVNQLITALKQGDQGENVQALQALLAADPTLYPEGLITGFYGPATAKAVKRFQEKNGIEGVGFVGPKTAEKLNQLLSKYPVAFQVDDNGTIKVDLESKHKNKDKNKNKGGDDDDDKKSSNRKLCAIVPPGHMIAPGWIKKNGQPVIPTCQSLPPGILEKLGIIVVTPTSTPTSTVDTTAPVLSGISASGISATAATINWSTNESATSKVHYSTSSTMTADSAPWHQELSGFRTTHAVPLSGLTAATTYYYIVESKDIYGNKAVSGVNSFITTATADTTAPQITSQTVTPATSTAVIAWTTNEVADSQIFYGTTTGYGASTTLNTTLVTSHSQTLSGLTPNTTYFYQIRSKDAAGNLGTLAGQFMTNALPVDATAPTISNVTSTSVSSTIASISWTTNEPATSKVYYGTANPLVLGSAAFQSSATLVTSHLMNLTGLTASTTYYYVVESADAANNTATSSQQSFMTLGL